MRSYDQYCSLARALDIDGDWLRRLDWPTGPVAP
jgi:hypothetical protein